MAIMETLAEFSLSVRLLLRCPRRSSLGTGQTPLVIRNTSKIRSEIRAAHPEYTADCLRIRDKRPLNTNKREDQMLQCILNTRAELHDVCRHAGLQTCCSASKRSVGSVR